MKPIEKMTPKEILLYKKKLLEQKAQIQAQTMPLLAREDYATYVEYTHLYDKNFSLAKFQRYICGCIDKLIKGELLNDKGIPYEGICLSQPAQTGKSRTITETLPSYYLGKNPHDHVIEISYGDDLANRFGRRNIEKINEFGKQLFGLEISPDKKAADEFEIAKTKGGMLSRGIGAAITGSPSDLTIVDDPYKNRQDADSQTYKQFVINEWLNTIRTRASAKCKYIIVHTRWNEDDLIGYLLDNEPDKWFEIRFPLEAEEYEEITGRQPGDALLIEAGKDNAWLKRFKQSFINDPTEGGMRAWNALMQQRPSSLEGNMIKREYWKRYDLTLEMQRQGFFPVKIQSWDCALKDTADPVAGGVWGKMGANCYIVDHVGGRMDIVKTMEGIEKFTKDHPDATAKLVEDKANGPAAIRMLRDKIFGLIPVNPGTKSKAERVNTVLPLFIAGNVYIPKRIEVSPGIFVHCEWADYIIEQCAAFKPDKKVQRDDEVDQCSQALNWLMYQKATPTATEQRRDTFLLGPEPENMLECSVSDSFINFGM
jgi:predicted phage terminase large subunit-like protein